MTLFGTNTNYMGDIIFLSGVLLAYIYRFIKSYSFKTILPIIIVLAVVRTLSKSASTISIITTIISSGLVLFMWVLLKTELSQYIRESRKNESLARIGLNAGNFIHNLHLATAKFVLESLERSFEEEDREKMQIYITNLKKWVNEKTKLRHQIVAAWTATGP